MQSRESWEEERASVEAVLFAYLDRCGSINLQWPAFRQTAKDLDCNLSMFELVTDELIFSGRGIVIGDELRLPAGGER